MKRRRFEIPGHVHELTFACYKNQPLLECDRTCRYLVEAIKRAKYIHNFSLLAYVFMPNHVHLLIWPRTEIHSIAKILLSIKQSVSRRELIFSRKNDLTRLRLYQTNDKNSPYRIWQDGGGYDRNIISSGAIKNSIYYIHNNPIRKKLVSDVKDWYWSSFSELENPGSGPLVIDIFKDTLI